MTRAILALALRAIALSAMFAPPSMAPQSNGAFKAPVLFLTKSNNKIGPLGPVFVIGRGGGIRTHDPLPPRQMRYQAALRPDRFTNAHDNRS